MRSLSFVATVALLALPAMGSAQIIRDSVAASAKPPAPEVLATAPGNLTPGDLARFGQRDFEAYRHLHLPHVMPRLSTNCDEKVGRFCYWYDESTPMPREPEDIKARRARLISALDSLARILPRDFWIAEQRVRYLAESERWQDAVDAARACTDYGDGNGWRCETLVGFALHLKGDYVAAEQVFDSAISHMGPKESCEWRDISVLLDDVALGQFRALPCGDPGRELWSARTWFLARTLYSMKGNDSRTEYFARMAMVQMLRDAPGAYQFGFDDDERELLLRFGWPRAWAAQLQLPVTFSMTGPGTNNPGNGGGNGGTTGTGGGSGGPTNVGGAKGKGRGGTGVGSYPPGTKIPGSVPPLVRPPDMPGGRGLPGGLGGPPDARPGLPRLPGVEMRPRDGDGINVVGMEPFPAYRYIPAGFVLNDPPQSDSAAWRLQLPPVMGRYAPPYAKALVPLEHQKAVFRRGDSAIVVMAYDTKGTKAVDGAKIRAGLVVTAAEKVPREFVAVRDSAPSAGVLTVHAPWGPLLMSAEVSAASRNAVARARYGVGPIRGPQLRVALSDLLFYKSYGTFPASVEEVAPHALPTERVSAKEKLGVYWEAYGTDPGGEKIKVSLVVARENDAVADEEPGFFRRLARVVGIGRSSTPVSVGVDDVSARGRATSARAIELDISTLTKGAYIVQLEITVAGQPVLRAEHRIEVVAP